MTIYISAYDTQVGSALFVPKTLERLQEAMVRGDFARRNIAIKGVELSNERSPMESVPTYLTNGSDEERLVPTFVYPMVVPNVTKSTMKNKTWVVGDVRSTLYADSVNNSDGLRVRLSTDFQMIRLMTVLTAIWASGDQNSFQYMGHAPMSLYARWIASSIRIQLGLAEREVLQVELVAMAYYQMLFEKETSLTEKLRTKFAVPIALNLRMQTNDVFIALDKIDKLSTLDDLCVAIGNVVESSRVELLNAGLLASNLSASWQGTNANFLCGAAIQHIPTWLVLAYMVITDRSYKRTKLGQLRDGYAAARSEESFDKAIKHLVSKANTSL